MIASIETIEQPAFFIAGIAVRTTNQNGQAVTDIGSLWTRFMTGGILQQIEGRITDDIYCVYTDYETDHTGSYTTLLGCKVHSVDNQPADFSKLTINAGKYNIYSLSGKFPENVHEAWVEIWNSGVERSYTADFDRYTANAKSFAETEVKIFVAVK
jgi:predicted transcriptional regulator YdeE